MPSALTVRLQSTTTKTEPFSRTLTSILQTIPEQDRATTEIPTLTDSHSIGSDSGSATDTIITTDRNIDSLGNNLSSTDICTTPTLSMPSPDMKSLDVNDMVNTDVDNFSKLLNSPPLMQLSVSDINHRNSQRRSSTTVSTVSTNPISSSSSSTLSTSLVSSPTSQQQQQIPNGYSIHIQPSLSSNQKQQQMNAQFDNRPMAAISTNSTTAHTVSTSSFPLIQNYAAVSKLPIPSLTTSTASLVVSNPLTTIVTDETIAEIVSNTSVPEFLYQLTKMLTDDHRDIIEWSSGRIEVHNPHRLESEVLNKYFRHSKYASFQRQLNYFGFRKMAGKGKMSPCSYVNENATSDLSSLLRMKRKTSANTKDGKSNPEENNKNQSVTSSNKHPFPSPTSKQAKKSSSSSNKRARTNRHNTSSSSSALKSFSLPPQQQPQSTAYKVGTGLGIKHQLNGYHKQQQQQQQQQTQSSYNVNNPLLSNDSVNTIMNKNSNNLDPMSIAKAAVGKGVTHQSSSLVSLPTAMLSSGSYSITSGIAEDSSNNFTFLDPPQLGMGIENCLSELQTNFRNSLNETNDGSNNNNNANNNNGGLPNSNVQYNSYSSNGNKIMERESSLVDLAMIPSLSSTYKHNMKSNEVDYAITFHDFPTGGIDPSTLPPPEDNQ